MPRVKTALLSPYRSYVLAAVLVFALVCALLASIGPGDRVFGVGNNSPEACSSADVTGVEGDPTAVYDASPNVVAGVCIKSGDNMFGETGHSGLLGNGVYEGGCYEVTGVGTTTVTVARLASGPTCQNIGHVDIDLGDPPPPPPPPPPPGRKRGTTR